MRPLKISFSCFIQELNTTSYKIIKHCTIRSTPLKTKTTSQLIPLIVIKLLKVDTDYKLFN